MGTVWFSGELGILHLSLRLTLHFLCPALCPGRLNYVEHKSRLVLQVPVEYGQKGTLTGNRREGGKG